MPTNFKSLKGQLLLDPGKLQGSFFHRTVILICQHDAEGAFGLVLNRAADTTVGSPDTHPGKGTYDTFCGICHKVGVGGAPIVGDPAQWRDRIAAGFDAMLDKALNGVSSPAGVMPPKGGFTQLTDEQVADALRYMVGESR